MKKNALVKVRLCPDCSWKLNYRKKQKEVTKSKEERKKDKKRKREEKEKEDERLDEKVAKMKEEEQGRMWMDSLLLHMRTEKIITSRKYFTDI